MQEQLQTRKPKATLNIVRYSTQELIDFIAEEFYINLATSKQLYYQNKVTTQECIRPRARYKLRQERISDILFSIDYFESLLKKQTDPNEIGLTRRALSILRERLNLEQNFDISHQKAEYARTGDVFATHSFTEFPLNKKLNSLYDDFNAVVTYYDNLTNDEIITKLETAPTLEEKIQIVKDNVEITHMALSFIHSSRAHISLMGKLDPIYSDIKQDRAQMLPPHYSDFNKVTLEDCELIKNNDLAQIIQERIDMDKESLILEHQITIKGEEYKIFRSPYTGKEYIRYVCPSTQRVYYNVLNFEYLSESKYFVEGDPSTYAKAWVHIANLFIDLNEEEIQRPSISC